MSEIICPHCNKAFTIDESDYAKLISQVRNAEFQKEINEKLKAEEDRHKAEADRDLQKVLSRHQADLAEKEKRITELESKLAAAATEREMEVTKAVKLKDDEISKKQQEITKLESVINQKDTEKLLAVTQAEQKKDLEIADKDSKIQRLSSEMELKDKEFEIKTTAIKSEYEKELKMKDETIEQYKDFKARLSTKMVGETLEQHCSIQFNQLRMTAFPDAYFEKDNDAKTGSKGDFIFRDFAEDGTEYISIMFEMKNESDTTSSKHKNEDFFKELDKDRNEKKCEYAVLVSMLEADNEFYNNGIVDVSYRYPKMYVIRPQFFIPLITLLRNAARNSLEYQRKLKVIQEQQADLTTFESNIASFKESFLKTFDNAAKKHQEAIEGIDKAIDMLTKIKAALQTSDKHLNAADRKLESDLTIKRLTKNADSVYDKLIEIRGKEQQ